MAQIDFTKLDNVQNLTLDQFKEAYRNGHSVAAEYYQELELQGRLKGNDNGFETIRQVV